MTLTISQIRTDEQLRDDGFNAEEIKFFRSAQADYYEAAIHLDDANEAKDYEKALELEPIVNLLELRLLYQGKSPKEVPLDVFRTLLNAPVDDRYIETYMARVKNPATAIRAYCVNSMNGQVAEVRRCENTSCPFWMFRLGTNPLFGKPLPPVKDIKFEDDDDVAVEEETDNQEAKE